MIAAAAAAPLAPAAAGASSWLPVAPVILCLIAAAVCLVLRKAPDIRHVILVGATLAAALAAVALLLKTLIDGPQAIAMGNWPPPFGIGFSVDAASALLAAAAAATVLMIVLHQIRLDSDALSHPQAAPLILIFNAGALGSLLTGDIFNLYVWLEVMLISAFGLLTLGGRPIQLDGAVKYAFLNLFATTLFLIATALLYAVAGTLNMADLHLALARAPASAPTAAIGILFLVGVGMKAAAFPLFFWLPAAYHTPYPSIAALLAALSTKVGLYILFRLTTLIFVEAPFIGIDALGFLAAGGLLIGGAGMLADPDPRRLIGWAVISSSATVIMGLSFIVEHNHPLAVRATLYYLAQSIPVMAALYLISERVLAARQRRNAPAPWENQPLLCALFLFAAAAVAGAPPMPAFWGKILLLRVGLDLHAYGLIAVLTLSTFLTLIAMGRFSVHLLMTSPAADRAPQGARETDADRPVIVSLGAVFIVGFIVANGFFPNTLIAVSSIAAEQTVNPSLYIDATLGDRR